MLIFFYFCFFILFLNLWVPLSFLKCQFTFTNKKVCSSLPVSDMFPLWNCCIEKWTCCGVITWKSAGVVRIRCVPLWVSKLYICCELFTVIYSLSLPAENGYSGFFKNVQFDIKGSGFLKLMITVYHILWGRGWKFWNWYTPGARVF